MVHLEKIGSLTLKDDATVGDLFWGLKHCMIIIENILWKERNCRVTRIRIYRLILYGIIRRWLRSIEGITYESWLRLTQSSYDTELFHGVDAHTYGYSDLLLDIISNHKEPKK